MELTSQVLDLIFKLSLKNIISTCSYQLVQKCYVFGFCVLQKNASSFSGRDASRAFVTGQFDEEGLTDDIEGLSTQDYLGLDEWLNFYKSDYKFVGEF